jgi:alkylhydroperoxidase/carboxymuconolactone decarboxylase family protein YurZ
MLPTASWIRSLEQVRPKFTEGLHRVVDLIDRDTALPRQVKLLFCAAIAAVKRDQSLVEHFVSACAAAALPRDHAEGASVGLLISRGVTPHRLFVSAVDRTYGAETGGGPLMSADGYDADVQGAYRYFEQYFGFVPDYVELLGQHAGQALEGYFLMREAALGETPLAAEYESRFVGIHARGARRAGATEKQLVEAALTALPFAGVASWLPAAQGIIESRDAG